MSLENITYTPPKIQSVIFDRDSWTKKKAKEWLKQYGYEYKHLQEINNYWLRYHQHTLLMYKSFHKVKADKGVWYFIGNYHTI